MAKRGDEYFILVVCDGEGKVVGTGCVFVERKLYVLFSLGGDGGGRVWEVELIEEQYT